MRSLSIFAGALLIAYGLMEVVIASDPKRYSVMCRYWACWNQAVVDDAYREFLGGAASPQEFSQDLVQVLAHDPASSIRWCDLGEALLASGDQTKAAYCMNRALALGPDSAPVLLRVANFNLRAGNDNQAFKQLARILATVPDYDEIVFSDFDRFGGGIDRVLALGLPADKRAAQAFLRQEMQSGAIVDDVRKTWSWLSARKLTDDPVTLDYLGYLLRVRQFDEAVAVWLASVSRNRGDYMKPNRIFNGDFELAPSGSPLDWRIDQMEAAQIARDASAAHSGQYSMHLQFAGTQNVDFHHVSETTIVSAGTYRIEYFIKTDNITTNEGVRLHVYDPEHSGQLDVLTDASTGTNDWEQKSAIFTVKPQTRIVRVEIVRLPSRKFDNKIAGAAWIDGVKIVPN